MSGKKQIEKPRPSPTKEKPTTDPRTPSGKPMPF